MPTCFLVPGFMGTQLRTTLGQSKVVWVSYTAIALGEIGALRLAPDGISPGLPDGEPMQVGQLLTDYYLEMFNTLERELRPEGYRILEFAYDWRLSVFYNGALLRRSVETQATPTTPCTIVAHSMGCLVALAAWRELVERGNQSFVRRIVCLGAPFQGTYRPAKVFLGDDELITQVRRLSGLVRLIAAPGGGYFLLPSWTQQRISALAATWPGLYEMLPILNPETLAADPNRAHIYEAAAWPQSSNVQQRWLDHAKNDVSPLLSNPATYPPLSVLTTVAGTGFPTEERLLAASGPDELTSFAITDEGDDTMTVASSLITNSATYTLPVAHADLSRVSASLDRLKEWVLEERSNAPPPPLEVNIGGPTIRLLSGPPMPQFMALDHDC